MNVKRLFKIVVFGVFIFQMQNSIRNYVSMPVIKQSSTTSLEKIKRPVIYICQDAQFNYTKARGYGYNFLTDFNIGKLAHSDNITWTGKDGNTSFDELQEKLFNVDYTNLTAWTSVSGDQDDWNPAGIGRVYFTPNGFCMKLLGSASKIKFYTTKQSTVLVTDPSMESKLMIPRINNGKFSVGPIGKELFNEFVYELEVSLHDAHMHHGKTCYYYSNTEENYEDCLANGMKKSFLAWYSCLPPWFPYSTAGLVHKYFTTFIIIYMT